MRISDVDVAPGEVRKIEVNLARLPSHSDIDISVTVARSTEPGPVLLLSGGLHGDEINGIEIVRRIIEKNLHVPKRGCVICIPIINIYGFVQFSRYVPDGKDVNRSFPGNKAGSLAARVANFMMKEIIPNIDYGIDFHTGGADRTNYPQMRGVMSDPVNSKIAAAFRAPFTVHSKFRAKSFRHAAAKLGKRILVYEGGESGRFDEFAIKEGLEGTLRVMHYLDMTDTLNQAKHNSCHITSSKWVRPNVSGLFQSGVVCGQYVSRKQVVGHITDPFGDYRESIKSPTNGYVIGLNNNPIVHQGDAIMHIGKT